MTTQGNERPQETQQAALAARRVSRERDYAHIDRHVCELEPLAAALSTVERDLAAHRAQARRTEAESQRAWLRLRQAWSDEVAAQAQALVLAQRSMVLAAQAHLVASREWRAASVTTAGYTGPERRRTG